MWEGESTVHLNEQEKWDYMNSQLVGDSEQWQNLHAFPLVKDDWSLIDKHQKSGSEGTCQACECVTYLEYKTIQFLARWLDKKTFTDIRSLRGHLGQAPYDIRRLLSTEDQFLDFLRTFGDVFEVVNGLVRLTNNYALVGFYISKISPECLCDGLDNNAYTCHKCRSGYKDTVPIAVCNVLGPICRIAASFGVIQMNMEQVFFVKENVHCDHKIHDLRRLLDIQDLVVFDAVPSRPKQPYSWTASKVVLRPVNMSKKSDAFKTSLPHSMVKSTNKVPRKSVVYVDPSKVNVLFTLNGAGTDENSSTEPIIPKAEAHNGTSPSQGAMFVSKGRNLALVSMQELENIAFLCGILLEERSPMNLATLSSHWQSCPSLLQDICPELAIPALLRAFPSIFHNDGNDISISECFRGVCFHVFREIPECSPACDASCQRGKYRCAECIFRSSVQPIILINIHGTITSLTDGEGFIFSDPYDIYFSRTTIEDDASTPLNVFQDLQVGDKISCVAGSTKIASDHSLTAKSLRIEQHSDAQSKTSRSRHESTVSSISDMGSDLSQGRDNLNICSEASLQKMTPEHLQVTLARDDDTALLLESYDEFDFEQTVLTTDHGDQSTIAHPGEIAVARRIFHLQNLQDRTVNDGSSEESKEQVVVKCKSIEKNGKEQGRISQIPKPESVKNVAFNPPQAMKHVNKAESETLQFSKTKLSHLKKIGIQNFTGHFSCATPEVREYVAKNGGLESVLKAFPSIFKVTSSTVSLVEHNTAGSTHNSENVLKKPILKTPGPKEERQFSCDAQKLECLSRVEYETILYMKKRIAQKSAIPIHNVHNYIDQASHDTKKLLCKGKYMDFLRTYPAIFTINKKYLTLADGHEGVGFLIVKGVAQCNCTTYDPSIHYTCHDCRLSYWDMEYIALENLQGLIRFVGFGYGTIKVGQLDLIFFGKHVVECEKDVVKLQDHMRKGDLVEFSATAGKPYGGFAWAATRVRILHPPKNQIMTNVGIDVANSVSNTYYDQELPNPSCHTVVKDKGTGAVNTSDATPEMVQQENKSSAETNLLTDSNVCWNEQTIEYVSSSEYESLLQIRKCLLKKPQVASNCLHTHVSNFHGKIKSMLAGKKSLDFIAKFPGFFVTEDNKIRLTDTHHEIGLCIVDDPQACSYAHPHYNPDIHYTCHTCKSKQKDKTPVAFHNVRGTVRTVGKGYGSIERGSYVVFFGRHLTCTPGKEVEDLRDIVSEGDEVVFSATRGKAGATYKWAATKVVIWKLDKKTSYISFSSITETTADPICAEGQRGVSRESLDLQSFSSTSASLSDNDGQQTDVSHQVSNSSKQQSNVEGSRPLEARVDDCVEIRHTEKYLEYVTLLELQALTKIREWLIRRPINIRNIPSYFAELSPEAKKMLSQGKHVDFISTFSSLFSVQDDIVELAASHGDVGFAIVAPPSCTCEKVDFNPENPYTCHTCRRNYRDLPLVAHLSIDGDDNVNTDSESTCSLVQDHGCKLDSEPQKTHGLGSIEESVSQITVHRSDGATLKPDMVTDDGFPPRQVIEFMSRTEYDALLHLVKCLEKRPKIPIGNLHGHVAEFPGKSRLMLAKNKSRDFVLSFPNFFLMDQDEVSLRKTYDTIGVVIVDDIDLCQCAVPLYDRDIHYMCHTCKSKHKDQRPVSFQNILGTVLSVHKGWGTLVVDNCDVILFDRRVTFASGQEVKDLTCVLAEGDEVFFTANECGQTETYVTTKAIVNKIATARNIGLAEIPQTNVARKSESQESKSVPQFANPFSDVPIRSNDSPRSNDTKDEQHSLLEQGDEANPPKANVRVDDKSVKPSMQHSRHVEYVTLIELQTANKIREWLTRRTIKIDDIPSYFAELSPQAKCMVSNGKHVDFLSTFPALFSIQDDMVELTTSHGDVTFGLVAAPVCTCNDPDYDPDVHFTCHSCRRKYIDINPKAYLSVEQESKDDVKIELKSQNDLAGVLGSQPLETAQQRTSVDTPDKNQVMFKVDEGDAVGSVSVSVREDYTDHELQNLIEFSAVKDTEIELASKCHNCIDDAIGKISKLAPTYGVIQFKDTFVYFHLSVLIFPQATEIENLKDILEVTKQVVFSAKTGDAKANYPWTATKVSLLASDSNDSPVDDYASASAKKYNDEDLIPAMEIVEYESSTESKSPGDIILEISSCGETQAVIGMKDTTVDIITDSTSIGSGTNESQVGHLDPSVVKTLSVGDDLPLAIPVSNNPSYPADKNLCTNKSLGFVEDDSGQHARPDIEITQTEHEVHPDVISLSEHIPNINFNTNIQNDCHPESKGAYCKGDLLSPSNFTKGENNKTYCNVFLNDEQMNEGDAVTTSPSASDTSDGITRNRDDTDSLELNYPNSQLLASNHETLMTYAPIGSSNDESQAIGAKMRFAKIASVQVDASTSSEEASMSRVMNAQTLNTNATVPRNDLDISSEKMIRLDDCSFNLCSEKGVETSTSCGDEESNDVSTTNEVLFESSDEEIQINISINLPVQEPKTKCRGEPLQSIQQTFGRASSSMMARGSHTNVSSHVRSSSVMTPPDAMNDGMESKHFHETANAIKYYSSSGVDVPAQTIANDSMRPPFISGKVFYSCENQSRCFEDFSDDCSGFESSCSSIGTDMFQEFDETMSMLGLCLTCDQYCEMHDDQQSSSNSGSNATDYTLRMKRLSRYANNRRAETTEEQENSDTEEYLSCDNSHDVSFSTSEISFISCEDISQEGEDTVVEIMEAQALPTTLGNFNDTICIHKVDNCSHNGLIHDDCSVHEYSDAMLDQTPVNMICLDSEDIIPGRSSGIGESSTRMASHAPSNSFPRVLLDIPLSEPLPLTTHDVHVKAAHYSDSITPSNDLWPISDQEESPNADQLEATNAHTPRVIHTKVNQYPCKKDVLEHDKTALPDQLKSGVGSMSSPSASKENRNLCASIITDMSMEVPYIKADTNRNSTGSHVQTSAVAVSAVDTVVKSNSIGDPGYMVKHRESDTPTKAIGTDLSIHFSGIEEPKFKMLPTKTNRPDILPLTDVPINRQLKTDFGTVLQVRTNSISVATEFDTVLCNKSELCPKEMSEAGDLSSLVEAGTRVKVSYKPAIPRGRATDFWVCKTSSPGTTSILTALPRQKTTSPSELAARSARPVFGLVTNVRTGYCVMTLPNGEEVFIGRTYIAGINGQLNNLSQLIRIGDLMAAVIVHNPHRANVRWTAIKAWMNVLHIDSVYIPPRIVFDKVKQAPLCHE